MILDHRNTSGPVVVTDFRAESDLELEEAGNGRHVLEMCRELRGSSFTRIALFEYGEKPDQRARQQAKRDLIDYLLASYHREIFVAPTVAANPDDRSDTMCWSAFSPPEGLAAMRSTFHEWADGKYVCPLFGFSPYLKQLQHWQNEQTLRKVSHELLHAQNFNLAPLPRDILALQDKPIAVDIESIEGTDIITAVGLSDGDVAMSVPVDPYQPYQHKERQPGASQQVIAALSQLLASSSPKIFHNHTFDIPRLEHKGYKVNGSIHDTFCAMAIAYPELAHGLQASCAILLTIPPWKSVWHPRLPGITRDDIEFWICDPQGLKHYNAQDAFYTWHLAAKVLPQVGVSLSQLEPSMSCVA